MNESAEAGGAMQLDYESSARHDDRLDLRVWLRLLTCASMIERRVRQRLRNSFDLTLPRFDLMAQLDRAPEGLTMGALSRRLMVTNGNVTGLIERMASEGVVERAAAPHDRRVQVVRLTRAGKAAFDAMTPEHGDWIEGMMRELSRKDLADLYALLARLKRSVEHAEKNARAGARGP
ncbi:MAG TPA: MarR family transcriptional regulator [Alphaproteobacteria bacterium]|nr:MarR family transcriptional regulator [Alphaproteobacteria bacterium]